MKCFKGHIVVKIFLILFLLLFGERKMPIFRAFIRTLISIKSEYVITAPDLIIFLYVGLIVATLICTVYLLRETFKPHDIDIAKYVPFLYLLNSFIELSFVATSLIYMLSDLKDYVPLKVSSSDMCFDVVKGLVLFVACIIIACRTRMQCVRPAKPDKI